MDPLTDHRSGVGVRHAQRRPLRMVQPHRDRVRTPGTVMVAAAAPLNPATLKQTLKQRSAS